MSVTVRTYRRGGWMVDINTRLSNGKRHRERKRLSIASKSAAQRWGEDRERHLLQYGLPQPTREVPTLKEFAVAFVADAEANRQKPSGIAAKETILRVHLVPRLGSLKLDAISNQRVQELKGHLHDRAPKTVNNVLTVLSTLLKRAVEWDVIERMPCKITLLRVPKTSASFHDFDAYERLVLAARTTDVSAHLIVLLGGEAGLRCGEMMALQWVDVDLEAGQMCIRRSTWKGQTTVPKDGRQRSVALTLRLAAALKSHRHRRGPFVLCSDNGAALTQRLVQGFVLRSARAASLGNVGVHVLRHTFCSHLAMRGGTGRAIQTLAGHSNLTTTERYMHLSPAALDTTIRLLDPRGNIVATPTLADENVNI
jgi:integrase